ncbi:MAG: hypothetical protein P1P65_05310 [Treponema sp.]
MIGSPVRQQLTIRFLHRTVLFLLSFLAALCAFFILGNIQNFLDSSQVIILKMLIAVGVLLAVLSVFTILFEGLYVLYFRRRRYLGRLLISVIACISGVLIAVISAVILLLSSGLQSL